MLRKLGFLSRQVRYQATIAATAATGATAATAVPSTGVERGSVRELDTTNGRPPLPVNVEAVYYAPLRNPIKYGDLVAELQLRSYDNENLDFFADFVMRIGFYLGMPLTGPKPLPTRRERWTVIKSPFAQAKSKENFERHTHKRLIRVWDTNPEIVDMWLSYLTKYSIAGVGAKCNTYHRTRIDSAPSKADILQNIEKLAKLDPGESIRRPEEVVGKKIIELLNSPEFKKHL